MKIISWNAWVKNEDQIKNFQALDEQEQANIYCLQEVDIKLLAYIQSEDQKVFDYAYCFDYRKFKKGYYHNYFLVILSKQTIENLRFNRVQVNHLTSSSLYDFVMRWDESIEYQFADITVNKEKYRIFNCHLELSAGPSLRLKQFQEIVDRFSDTSHNVVCGDFNIYAKPWLNFWIWWGMGFNFKEIFIDGREEFEKKFKKYSLTNAHKNKVTFTERELQLDHILVPNSIEIINNEVSSTPFGSDHYPIIVEI
jgi:endonuclease/exonuclease/phosphatase family metal-dependent hydrolase